MRFEPVDRPPLRLVGPWEDTVTRWRREGLPEEVDLNEYFGLHPLKSANAGSETGLFPGYESRVLEERGNEVIELDSYGRTVRRFKDHTSMPEWIDFPVKRPEDLKRVIDEQFDLDRLEERWPSGWAGKLAGWRKPEREVALFLDGGCYYWTLRSLCGVELASYMFYDAPELVDELFERINVVCLEGIKRAAPELDIDYIGFGEDIAYKTSTLISPDMFRRYILPRYRKVMDAARSHGIELTWYDSDGDIRPFMTDYFSVGIHCFAPCEVAAGMDPVALRRQWGREISMVGGIDKRVVAAGRDAIDQELAKIAPLVEEGGYIPTIDHSVSSDISLDNYRYFLDRLKAMLRIE